MDDSNPLGQMILKHWQTHHPKMLAEHQSNHQLEQTLHETQERAGDLLYELILAPENGLPDGVGDGGPGMDIPTEPIVRDPETEEEKNPRATSG